MSMPLRISLTDEDFKTLVGGGVVEKENVKIILQDIGYDRMIKLILEHEMTQDMQRQLREKGFNIRA